MPIHIRLQNLTKAYRQGDKSWTVLDRVQAAFNRGETVAIRGRSGSGKTTLLNLLAGLDTPTEGRIFVDGVELTSLSERKRTEFRRDHIGIVFQFFNLIPTLSVLENVLLPAELAGHDGPDTRERALTLLDQVGLVDRNHEAIDRLSGGEQQRVAIARALIRDPLLVLADEPTGNLDRSTGKAIMDLLHGMTRELGRTLILVTHSHEIASGASRILTIVEGRLVSETHPVGLADEPSRTFGA